MTLTKYLEDEIRNKVIAEAKVFGKDYDENALESVIDFRLKELAVKLADWAFPPETEFPILNPIVDDDACDHEECQGHECMSFGTSACPETRPY